MTKVTVLHFASPFAFSMPLPAQSASRPASVGTSDGATAAIGTSAANPGGTSLASGAQSLASLAGGSEDDTSQDAGFASSLYDTVLRRYREQSGPPEAGGAAT